MKLNEISGAEVRNNISTKVKASVKTVGLTLIHIQLTSINDLYDEVKIDVKLPKGIETDSDFTHLPEVKKLRELLKEIYSGQIRGNSIVGMVAENHGRLVFQIKYKAT